MGGRGASSGNSNQSNFNGAGVDNAVFDYTTSRYLTINSGLRDDSTLSKEDQKIVDNLDIGISNSTLAEGTILYRGTSAEALGIDKNIRNMTAKDVKALTGQTITDKAYMSTSLSQSAASNFSGRSSGYAGNVNIVITSTAGSKGLKVGNNSNFGGGESEVILPRGSTLKITSATKRLGTLTVYATY